MTQLSDTQRVILSKARQRDDRLAVPPDRLPAAARQTVAKSLIKQGLVTDEDVGAANALNAWQIDGQPRVLRITLGAIGVEPDSGAAAPAMPDLPPAAASLSLPVEGQGDSHAASAPVPPATSDLGSEAHQQPPLSQHGRNGRAAALRPAAAAVVTAWNGSGRDGLDDAVTALRPAPAAAPHSRRDAAVLRQPRTGTKQQAILALLRRDEGATIAQIIEATGWQQHTVRGFLAGLKRRGITVEVLERVRQVGPSKQGAKGSYSIYRITAAAPVEAG